MKPLVLAMLACCLAALPASAATTPSVERVAIAGAGLKGAFPAGTSVELTSPPGYARDTLAGAHGTWIGPEYWASGDPTIRGNVEIGWTVGFAGARSANAAAFAGLTRGWSYRRKDPIAVPHVTGGHVIGTLPGFTVLTQAAAPADASYEGVLAFPVAQGTYAVVRFELENPPGDSAGTAGTYLVNGSVKPSVWAHGQVFWSFSGVALAGALAPKRVTAKLSGRSVHGTVLDYFRQPVRQARVTLQRFVGRRWRSLESVKSGRAGHYLLQVPRKGVYRVEARLGKTVVTSFLISVR